MNQKWIKSHLKIYKRWEIRERGSWQSTTLGLAKDQALGTVTSITCYILEPKLYQPGECSMQAQQWVTNADVAQDHDVYVQENLRV